MSEAARKLQLAAMARSRRSSSIRASSSSSMTPTARAPIFTKRSLPVLMKFS
jgi:hypothetical protein